MHEEMVQQLPVASIQLPANPAAGNWQTAKNW
jgi:hypothetical protein